MSRIRITGGQARGRILREPVSNGVRPTTDRVREALFSVVGQDLRGTTWFDAFGGTGIIALEAWSRGAEVTIVERDRRALGALRRRGAELGCTWTVHPGNVLKRAPDLGRFDIVYADPPYAKEPEPILSALAVTVGHTLIYEASTGAALPQQVGELGLDAVRTYGSTTLGWYLRVAPKDYD